MRGRNFFMKAVTLVFALLLVMPSVAFGAQKNKGRNKKDVFVNGHDARDGRWDGRGPRRNDDDDHRYDQRRRRRDRDYNDDYDQNGRRRDRDYNDDYDQNGRRRDRRYEDDYNNGGSYNLRQTALNAGYNNGIEDGRKDRQRGERYEYRDEGDYQNATRDYSSRLGDRELYRRYFRQGFANGYRDGYNGY